MSGRWGEAPFGCLAGVLALGIALSNRLRPPYSFWGIAAGILVLALAAAAALLRDRRRAALGAALGALLGAGVLLGAADRDAVAGDNLRALVATGRLPLERPLRFEGCVVEEAGAAGAFWVVEVEIHRLEATDPGIACRGRVELRVPRSSADGPEPPSLLTYGARLRGWAEWSLPRNFANPGSADRAGQLARRGIFLVGRVKSPRLLAAAPGDCARAWKRRALAARARIRGDLRRLADRGRVQEAAVLGSLVLGDASELDPRIREEFQNAGTYHVLVVSGLHVAWIAWVVGLACRLLRLPRAVARGTAAATVLAYAALVGFQPSVARALGMLALLETARALCRARRPDNLVLGSAFLLLVASPGWLADPGFQLSYLSVLGIVLVAPRLGETLARPLLGPLGQAGDPSRIELAPCAAARAGRRWRVRAELTAEALADRGPGWAGGALLGAARLAARGLRLAWVALAVSLAAVLWLEPLLAFDFNRLSRVAPLANLVVVPLASLALAGGLLTSAVALVAPAPDGLGDLAAVGAALLTGANAAMAGLPGAWQRVPTPPAWCVAGALALVAAWSFQGWGRFWIPAGTVGLLLAWLAAGPGPAADGRLTLTFLDVGQGDAIVLRFPDGRVWTLDAGGVREGPASAGPRFDVGEAVVSRYLWSGGVRTLDRVLLSHPHHDHAGGLPALLRNFGARELDHAGPRSDPTLEPLLAIARRLGVPAREVAAGTAFRSAGVGLRVLNPPREARGLSVNDRSLVLRLEYGRFSALLTGDLEQAGEAGLVAGPDRLDALLLKVAHHGSRSATLDALLERTRPRWAVISAGRNNPFGHPSRDVLLRLARRGTRPLPTLDQGAVTVTTDGKSCRIESFRGGLIEDRPLATPDARSAPGGAPGGTGTPGPGNPQAPR